MTKLPLSIREVTPGLGSVKIFRDRKDGLPDGYHTGGVYEFQGEVWKPLDGRPYANCENHFPTQEDEALLALSEHPWYPKNWRTEVRNNRRWLVRPTCYQLDDVLTSGIKRDFVLKLEDAVRFANGKGWFINDYLSILIDPNTYQPFIGDLSCAQYRNTPTHLDWEGDRVERFLEDWKCDVVFNERRNTESFYMHAWAHDRDFKEVQYIYGSFNRPLSRMWATLPKDAVLFDNDQGNWTKGIPWTFITTTEPLSDELIHRYELRWCWSPWPVRVPNISY